MGKIPLKTIIDTLLLEVKCTGGGFQTEVTGAYVSDLLSDVIANAQAGELWLTLQIHPNIVAVAVLKELSGIILVNNRQPDEDTLKKAEQEGIPILVSRLTAFVLAGRLFKLFG